MRHIHNKYSFQGIRGESIEMMDMYVSRMWWTSGALVFVSAFMVYKGLLRNEEGQRVEFRSLYSSIV